MRHRRPKAELSPRMREVLMARLWDLPFGDRVAALSLSVIERNNEAHAAEKALTSLIVTMSASYSDAHKILLAEDLRSAADVLDRQVRWQTETETTR